MRIVAVADTHSQHHRLPPIPEGDVLIHAGDLTGRGTVREIAEALQFFRALPHPHKILIAGNHDFAFQRDPNSIQSLLEGFTYLQDSSTTIDGIRFWGSPWQPYFGGWAFNLLRGPTIAEKWALIPEDTDVLITHGPPFGFGDDVGYERVGCKDLKNRLRIVNPKHHLYGHIHEDRGSWVFGKSKLHNVTTADSTLPATVIDL